MQKGWEGKQRQGSSTAGGQRTETVVFSMLTVHFNNLLWAETQAGEMQEQIFTRLSPAL